MVDDHEPKSPAETSNMVIWVLAIICVTLMVICGFATWLAARVMMPGSVPL